MPVSSFGIALAPRPEGRLFSGPMILALLVALGCAVTRLSGLDQAGVSFCYFKALSGRACLTCGTTRAFGHLSRFDLASAFAIQPLVTAGALGILAWGTLDAGLLLASRRTRVHVEGRALRVLTAVIAVLALLNWAYLLATGV